MVMPLTASGWLLGAGAGRWIGLDLSDGAECAVEIERAAKGIRLLRYAASAAEVRKLLQACAGREVHAAAAGSGSILRRLRMPVMPAQELAEAVKWELKDQVSFPIHDAVCGVQVIGEVVEQDVKKLDVLGAVAPKLMVTRLVEALKAQGVRAGSIVPAAVATLHGITAVMPEAGKGSVAVVNVGAAQTSVVIASEGQPMLTRDVAFGADTLTNTLIGTVALEQGADVHIDHAKAERLKQHYGIVPQGAEGATEEGVPLFHLASLMRPVMEQLLTELGRLFDFYRMEMSDAGISRVLLCGRDVTLKHFQQAMAEGLGLPVEVCNPLTHLAKTPESITPEQSASDGPLLATAIGLALDHGQRMSLLPSAAPARPAGALPSSRTLRLALAGVAAAAFVCYGALFAAAQSVHGRLQRQQQRWAQLEPSYTKHVQLIAATRELGDTEQSLQAFAEHQPLWDGLFKELSVLIPPHIQLSEVSIDQQAGRSVLRLKGQVGSGGMAGVIDALERSPFFADVQLMNSEIRSSEIGATTFSLEAVLE